MSCNVIAKFEKVSLDRFKEDCKKSLDFRSMFHPILEYEFEELYPEIQLPRRATKGSAGYDFFSPFDFGLIPGETIKIPTGIRVKIEEGWCLQCFPRSGLGFKYRLQLDNTVGIIDSDYYESDNEGHIFLKLTNDTKDKKILDVEQGYAIAQGIFIPYGLAEGDDAYGIRNGGFGSTDK